MSLQNAPSNLVSKLHNKKNEAFFKMHPELSKALTNAARALTDTASTLTDTENSQKTQFKSLTKALPKAIKASSKQKKDQLKAVKNFIITTCEPTNKPSLEDLELCARLCEDFDLGEIKVKSKTTTDGFGFVNNTNSTQQTLYL